MNLYEVKYVKQAFEDISGRVFEPDESFLSINDYVWGGAYRPDARAKVEWDDFGLRVTLCANEETIIAEETKFGGMVCRDSCLEFFVNPCPSTGDKYLNFEANPKGIMHIGLGAARENRRVFDAPLDGMKISVSRHEGAWWAVTYRVPFRAMIELCGGVEKTMRANFYTCDETIHPHFGVWNHVVSEKPDYHRPECFGQILLV